MEDQERGKQTDDPGARPHPPWVVRGIDYIKRYLEKRRTEKAHQSAIDRATKGTAWATWVIAIATILTVGAAIFQYVTLTGQLNEMKAAREDDDKATAEQLQVLREQADAMKASIAVATRSADAALAANRPWVIPKFKVTGLYKKSNQLSLSTHVELLNIGNSPAKNVFVSADLVQEGGTAEEDAQRAACERAASAKIVGMEIVAFPKQPVFSNHGSATAVKGDVGRFYLAGCVSYMFEGSAIIHQTGFILGLSEGEPQGGVPPLAIINVSHEGSLSSEDVSRLSLQQMLYGAFAN